jgi:hypothetical protein
LLITSNNFKASFLQEEVESTCVQIKLSNKTIASTSNNLKASLLQEEVEKYQHAEETLSHDDDIDIKQLESLAPPGRIGKVLVRRRNPLT